MSTSDSPGLVLHIQRVVTILQLLPLQCCSMGPALVPHSPTTIPELLQGLIEHSASPPAPQQGWSCPGGWVLAPAPCFILPLWPQETWGWSPQGSPHGRGPPMG